jgi:hypothetical protein
MRSNRVGPTFFAQVAQLGERQTEDLNVPGSSPGLGMFLPVNTTPFVKISFSNNTANRYYFFDYIIQ